MNLVHPELIDRSVVGGSFTPVSTTVLRANWCDVKSNHFCCTASCAGAFTSSQIWSRFNLINISHWNYLLHKALFFSPQSLVSPVLTSEEMLHIVFAYFCCALCIVSCCFGIFLLFLVINWQGSFEQKYAAKLHMDAGLFEAMLPVLMLFESCSPVFHIGIEKQKINSFTFHKSFDFSLF